MAGWSNLKIQAKLFLTWWVRLVFSELHSVHVRGLGNLRASYDGTLKAATSTAFPRILCVEKLLCCFLRSVYKNSYVS